ncbi:MAG: hypothetical protein ACE15D_16355 [Candidatus Eisenbacteria bacterium]
MRKRSRTQLLEVGCVLMVAGGTALGGSSGALSAAIGIGSFAAGLATVVFVLVADWRQSRRAR